MSPVTSFPFPSMAGGGHISSWGGKGPAHGLAFNPPSAIASRVSSAVSEVQDWWRDQLNVFDGSDDDS